MSIDLKRVAMLVVASAGANLPHRLERLITDVKWLERLEATPEDQLDEEQREVIAAVGVDPQRQ